jgi:Repeat of unknown function (DUF5648)
MRKSISKTIIVSLCWSILSLGCGSERNAETIVSSASETGVILNLREKATFVPELVPTVYRFAKISNGAYFYTGSEVEAQEILNNYPDFRYEGPAFERDTGTLGQAVFRFANLRNGGYFFTGSVEERDIVIRDYPHMRFEGSTFSVAPAADVTAKPVFRLANLSNGAYLYTLSPVERDYAVSLGNWRFEGTSFKAPRGSPLADRTWSVGNLLDTDDYPVVNHQVGIDDTGRALAVYLKSNGTRMVLYATRGQVSVAGVASWSAPSVIDIGLNGLAQSADVGSPFSLAVAPNGNAIMAWFTLAACTPSETYALTGTCKYLSTAEFNQATGVWSPPTILIDSPGAYVKARINNNGDVAVAYQSWRRLGPSGYESIPGIVAHPVTQGTPQYQVARLETPVLSANFDMTLDNSGRFVAAGEAVQGGTMDIVIYAGTVFQGLTLFGTIDLGAAPASFQSLTTSQLGRSALLYKQTSANAANSLFVALAGPSDITWINTEIGAIGSSVYKAWVGDDNQARLVNLSTCRYVVTNGANWDLTGYVMPSNCFANPALNSFVSDRNGSFVSAEYTNGFAAGGIRRWMSFDAKRNRIIRNYAPAANATYNSELVMDFNTSNGANWKAFSAAKSVNGQAVIVSSADFDALPTLNNTLGVSRAGVTNLWGWYLR